MSYFSENEVKLNIKVKAKESEAGLRECQAGAYWAIKAHFTESELPAIASLPTGSGKTALMMLTAFGLKAKRVLVVTPSSILREQTTEKFEKLLGLRTAQIISDETKNPQCHKVSKEITSLDEWEALKDYDVVVATPNVISRVYSESIITAPKDLFDVVFFDEAHHTIAPSWEALISTFENAKQVLLTATPYRNDRKRLPGKLVYNYPINKAMDSGIYSEVNYVEIDAGLVKSEKALIEKATEIFDEQRKKSSSVQILIRTNQIEKANRLEERYSDSGFKVKAIHSKKKDKENDDALNKLKNGELDGLIGVGKLAEGIDIPNLKIAVFHDPPKSFPFTIQLIGRVARTGLDQPSAYVIADPEKMREKGVSDTVRKLYHDDKGWKELIPDLIDQVAGLSLRNYKTGSNDLLLGANIEDLEPFYSTTLYRVKARDLDFTTKVTMDHATESYQLPGITGHKFFGIITEKEKSPSWAKKSGLFIQQFDLHIYFYHQKSEILFEHTTAGNIAEKIRDHVIKNKPQRIGGEELYKVLDSPDELDYLSAGMANAIGPSAALPDYKILMGSEVQGAVNLSDEQTFTRGHLLAKIGKRETRGISDSKGKVWSTKRSTIVDYLEWCTNLAELIHKNSGLSAPKNFNFFSPPEKINRFKTKPVLAIVDPRLQNNSLTVLGHEDQDPIDVNALRIDNLKFEYRSGQKKIDLELKVNETHKISVKYDVSTDTWENTYKNKITFKLDDGTDIDSLDLDDFLDGYPLWFYLKEGGLVKGNRKYPLKKSLSPLDTTCKVINLNWTNCEITNEANTTNGQKKNVHDWLEDYLKRKLPNSTIIFKDHGSGEIADFICLDKSAKKVSLYHCKSSPKKKDGSANIGATLGHVKDVIDQVIRSNGWVKSKRIFDQLRVRNDRPNNAKFIQNENQFDKLEKGFIPVEWDYEVYIVNPGLDFDAAVKDINVNPVLVTCHEWLKGTGTEFKIMGK